ncbi:hypothetical protein ES703_30356 [subsurface metagenome]
MGLRPETLSEAPREPQMTWLMYAVKPVANMFMPVPLTTWSPLNFTVSKAWKNPIRPPMRTAPTTPSQGFAV